MASSSSRQPPNNPNGSRKSDVTNLEPFMSTCHCCMKNLEQLHVQDLVKNSPEISPEDPRFFFRLFSHASKLDCDECEAVKLRLELLPSSCWTAHKDQEGFMNVMMRREHGHFMLAGTSVFKYFLATKEFMKNQK